MSFISYANSPVGQPLVPFQIRTAGFEVVASGTVITANNQNLEFQIGHLRVGFAFVSDGGQPRLGQASSSGSSLNMTLFNFNNSIGSGTTSPMEIGVLSGKKLWISFMVYALSPEASKTVHYTFMIGDGK